MVQQFWMEEVCTVDTFTAEQYVPLNPDYQCVVLFTGSAITATPDSAADPRAAVFAGALAC